MAAAEIDPESLRARVDALPGVERLRSATGGLGAHLVGGAVRDLLLGERRGDLDVVLEGDAIAVARSLGGELVAHERFGTASVQLDGLTIDLATARAESYPAPGALPVVRPGSLVDDLARRDFTVNAMAVPLEDPVHLVDPHGGAADLAARVLRVLHPGSFADDPTRALRAARYAARLGFALEPETDALLRRADLTTVSPQRVEAELRRLGAEPQAARALELAGDWGLVELDDAMVRVAHDVVALLSAEPWQGVASQPDVILALARGDLASARELASRSPGSPAEAVESAHGHDGPTLALARGVGAEWLDRYVGEWRDVRLEINGSDVLAAGIEEGPAIGRGLRAALRAKLDGEVSGRDQELRAALEAAGAA